MYGFPSGVAVNKRTGKVNNKQRVCIIERTWPKKKKTLRAQHSVTGNSCYLFRSEPMSVDCFGTSPTGPTTVSSADTLLYTVFGLVSRLNHSTFLNVFSGAALHSPFLKKNSSLTARLNAQIFIKHVVSVN